MCIKMRAERRTDQTALYQGKADLGLHFKSSTAASIRIFVYSTVSIYRGQRGVARLSVSSVYFFPIKNM